MDGWTRSSGDNAETDACNMALELETDGMQQGIEFCEFANEFFHVFARCVHVDVMQHLLCQLLVRAQVFLFIFGNSQYQ